MAIATLDGFSDPFYSREQEDNFEIDLREGSFWTDEESVALEAAIADIERMINNAPAIGRRVLHDSMFNMNHGVDEPWEFGTDPHSKLWF